MLSKKSQRDKERRQRLKSRLVNSGVSPKLASEIARGHTPKGYLRPSLQKKLVASGVTAEVGDPLSDIDLTNLLGQPTRILDSKGRGAFHDRDRFTGREIRDRERERGGLFKKVPNPQKDGQYQPSEEFLELLAAKGITGRDAWVIFFY